MQSSLNTPPKVSQVIPLLGVSEMGRSLQYYVDGLGFAMTNKWIVDGKVRWCRLELGDATVMLQEFGKAPEGKRGAGVSLWFQCQDAIGIYREVVSRGISASEPQVGNGLWETSLADPDGYRLNFASPTDRPEDTKLSEVEGA
jgi:lactoylglutathione lyase